LIRINKYLSICGVASRRKADELIEKGRVSVNNETVESLGIVIDEEKDEVKVDGKIITPKERRTYIVLNKPKDVITSLEDPFRRKTVAHYVRRLGIRVYPVGRLDYDTDGVLIMTNDGELAYRLAHPKYEVQKVYSAIVKGPVVSDDIDKIETGIELPDGHIAKAGAEIANSSYKTSRVILTMTEGRKREVKHIMEAVDHPVLNLRRISFAGIGLHQLKPGSWRHLRPEEVKHLKELVGLEY
jgi:23S rRNA pseudouridine2605 synthase